MEFSRLMGSVGECVLFFFLDVVAEKEMEGWAQSYTTNKAELQVRFAKRGRFSRIIYSPPYSYGTLFLHVMLFEP